MTARRSVPLLLWLTGGVLGAAAVLYSAIFAYLYLNQRALLYVPDTARPVLGDLAALGVREVSLTTADGFSLLAWYLPPPAGRPVVLYLHGNGGNLGDRTNRLRRYARERFGALFVEYRGYGGNPGTPSETGLYRDADAAFDFLAQHGVAAPEIVIYGESLGTGVAARMAATHPIGALILESPYTSIAAVAQQHYPFIPAARLILDKFDTLSRIGEVKAPLLVIWGGRDKIVPSHFAKQVFEAAPEPKERFFVAEGGHMNLDGSGALDASVAFIERHIR